MFFGRLEDFESIGILYHFEVPAMNLLAFYVLLFSIELYCYCSSCMKPTVPTFSIRYDPNLRHFCKCMELGET